MKFCWIVDAFEGTSKIYFSVWAPDFSSALAKALARGNGRKRFAITSISLSDDSKTDFIYNVVDEG